MDVPIENREYCGVPIEALDTIVWSDLIQDKPEFYSNDGSAFAVKFDNRKPKPACLEPYDSFPHSDLKAIARDPQSIWYRDPHPSINS